jgi:release factor glutamine methyltransferase
VAFSIQRLLQQDMPQLQAALQLEGREARIELQMLLQAVLKVPRSYLLAHPERPLNEAEQSAYQALLQRRLAGEPMAHIMGEREFFGLNLKVTPATLIPRPETELLVELALQRLSPHAGLRVLDLGTGSGAIALAIAHARPDVEMLAVDASAAALEVARENAQRLGLCNVKFQHSDWFSALSGNGFDLIVSNPPYIAADDVHLSQGDVRFEPLSALASGVDGLDDIRRIVAQAGDFLEPGGWLLLEHGYDQAPRVREILLQHDYVRIFSVRDLAGIERASGAARKE